ncbi:MocR-like pyridoxine biosynthesis transcription factor PdxR [Streptomyces sp. NPDC055210]
MTVPMALDLLVSVPDGPRRSACLQAALRQAIRSGALRAGARLPSTRTLAADLGMSRTTVVDAYAHLTAEGWLATRQGAGTTVAEVPCPALPAPGPVLLHDLRPGRPERGSFPQRAWSAAVRTVLARPPGDLWDYGHPAGRPELRTALAEYLGRVRGVRADPERVVVCDGFSGGLGWVASLLPPSRIAVEACGSAALRAVLRRHGHEVVPIPVDQDGAVTDALADLAPVAVLLTPAHHYPLGVTLGAARRAALLEWARRRSVLVIEDDHDAEFRHDGPPVRALQAQDPARVVHGGSVSKTLAPALRLGWLVLPPGLTVPGSHTSPVPALPQLALAEMLRTGTYDRHVRRMRRRYRARRDLFVHRLGHDLPQITVTGVRGGLQAVLALPGKDGTQRVLASCRARGIGVGTLDVPGAMVAGYGIPPAHAFGQALDALVRAIRENYPVR